MTIYFINGGDRYYIPNITALGPVNDFGHVYRNFNQDSRYPEESFTPTFGGVLK